MIGQKDIKYNEYALQLFLFQIKDTFTKKTYLHHNSEVINTLYKWMIPLMFASSYEGGGLYDGGGLFEGGTLTTVLEGRGLSDDGWLSISIWSSLYSWHTRSHIRKKHIVITMNTKIETIKHIAKPYQTILLSAFQSFNRMR